MKTFALSLLLASAAWSYDLVVYGGTAGGVMTAISGARHGLSTVLLEPGRHVGGMVTGGLSGTDVGKIEVIGGMALEFYWRAGKHYQVDRHLQQLAWMPEPGAGEKVMRQMLADAKVTLLTGHRLVEKAGVEKQGKRIIAIKTENGGRFEAKIFADCTYEGDLMAQAGVSYTYGRESRAQYGESLAGIQDHTENHNFPVDIKARDANGELLPEISPAPRGTPGEADKRIQAYNFRVIATKVPENRVPWPRPKNYDPNRYALLARYLKATAEYIGRPLTVNEVGLIRVIPNGKADLNNRGGFSTDYIGKNYDYPEGSYSTRARIWQDHIDYQQGLYYFLANDPQVDPKTRAEWSEWGLAKDEFTDTNNWPNQLYVREARRMVGDYVATQKDLQTELSKPDVIGMGSYNSDSHNVQRYATPEGIVLNEGNMEVPVKPYQIPYRVLTPKASESENLLVPVCFSASHVVYSSMRMEPQYMILGHAAGIAAAQAVAKGTSVQNISIPELQKTLLAEGGIFTQGVEIQLQALAKLKAKFDPITPRTKAPWARRQPPKN